MDYLGDPTCHHKSLCKRVASGPRVVTGAESGVLKQDTGTLGASPSWRVDGTNSPYGFQ